jgi:hypothetical protein
MRRIFLIPSLSFLLIFMTLSDIFAQQQVIKLWPEAIPGSTLNPSYVESAEKGTDNITRVFRVSDPELIVYPAPEDKANGTAIHLSGRWISHSCHRP